MGPGHKKKEYALIKVVVSLYNPLLSSNLKPDPEITSSCARLVWQLEHLTAVPEGSVINFNVLRELKVVQKTKHKRIKVLGNSINSIGLCGHVF